MESSKWLPYQSFGASISLPPEMSVVDLSGGDFQRISADTRKKFPSHTELTRFVEKVAVQGAAKNKLIAMSSYRNANGGRDEVNLFAEQAPPGVSLDDLGKTKQAELRRSPRLAGVSMGHRTLPCGDSIYLEAQSLSRSKPAQVCVYVLLHLNYAYYFTFICGGDTNGKWEAMAESAMKSVYFLRN